MSEPLGNQRKGNWRAWNRHFWIPLSCAVLCIVVILPWVAHAAGGEGGFDGVVNSIESRYHAHAMRVPLMGLASVVAGAATHGGVGGIHVAVFEQFSESVDGDELNRMTEEKLGEGWERMIRETSRHGNEQTLIFSHPEGKRMGLFVLDLQGKELNVVQVSVDADRLNETIIKYKHLDGDQSGKSD
ncbi:MAG TPA: hypothetical protein VGG45_13925 [Terracidiphilus sp.]|jgi:hypothetical protein